MKSKWNNPVVEVFRERAENPEKTAFLVMRVGSLELNTTSEDSNSVVLMNCEKSQGDPNEFFSSEHMTGPNILCWHTHDGKNQSDPRKLIHNRVVEYAPKTAFDTSTRFTCTLVTDPIQLD